MVVALIKSVDPSLSASKVEQVIKDSADPFAAVSDRQCTEAICGSGYTNASATIAAFGGDPEISDVLANEVVVTGLSGRKNEETCFTLGPQILVSK